MRTRNVNSFLQSTGEATFSLNKENTSSLTFTIEEEIRYSVRFEEGYDLFDERYQSWLKVNHPDAVTNTASTVLEPLRAPKSSTPIVSPSPSVTDTSSNTSLVSQSSSVSESKQTSTRVKSTVSGPSSSTHPLPGSTPLSTTARRRSPLSDLLNLPKNVRKPSTKTPSTGRARVLTSDECLRLLKEKEEKKKQVQMEKEKRKKERELKKKQREEEQKQKAEEKAKKAAEREAAKAKREAARAEKNATKAQSTTSGTTSGTKRRCPTNQRQAQKKARCELDEMVDDNLCCVCFGSYDEDIGTGREWVECSCKRWLHEDCVDEEDMDSNGKLCPLC